MQNQYIHAVTLAAIAFVVGFVAQFLKIKVDPATPEKNIFWLSVAAGFTSAIVIGLVNEKIKLSPAFLASISGVIGWGGVAVMQLLSKGSQDFIQAYLEKKYGTKDGK